MFPFNIHTWAAERSDYTMVWRGQSMVHTQWVPPPPNTIVNLNVPPPMHTDRSVFVCTVCFHIRKIYDKWQRPGGGGGWGHSPQILVGMCRGNVKNWGLRSKLERENARLRSELELWKWGLRKLTEGRIWPAATPRRTALMLNAFGLAAVSRPSTGMKGFTNKDFFLMIVSGAEI